MNRSIGIVSASFYLLFCVADAYGGSIERAPAGEKVTPFIQSGNVTAFSFGDGMDGANQAVKYELHQVESMISAGAPSITFEVENGKPGSNAYFKAKYRVIYMTKPLTASAVVTSIPVPLPPFFGSPVSNVYVMGVLIDTNPAAPKLTPWLRLDSLQVMIEK